jgi:hypothetical protein
MCQLSFLKRENEAYEITILSVRTSVPVINLNHFMKLSREVNVLKVISTPYILIP